MLQVENLHQAYIGVQRELLTGYQFINSPRGNNEIERLGLAVEIRNPTSRGVYVPARKMNLAFSFAEVLWYLSGKNDLEFIVNYAPVMRRYSSDGVKLPGTGYGPKIFSQKSDQLSQWDAVYELLQNVDRDSKRGVVQIFSKDESLTNDNIDVSCTLSLQFLVRDSRLWCVSYMRANDIYRGFLSDVFSFSFLQEVMAKRLGLQCGSLIHLVGSAHIYEDDISNSKKIIEFSEVFSDRNNRVFPDMPNGNPVGSIKRVLEIEEETRKKPELYDLMDMASGLDEYWVNIVLVLYEFNMRKSGYNTAAVLEVLPDCYAEIVGYSLNREKV